jgi:hypothetical protein
MRGKRIISILLMCALLLTGFLFFQEEAEATVDYIVIVDTAFTGAVEIMDQTVDPGFTIWGYAAAFNSTSGYISDVNCTWTVINTGNSTAYTSPPSGEGSQFFADLNPGEATWIADDGFGHSDSVVFYINFSPYTTDYIQIRDASGEGGNDLGDLQIIPPIR